MAQQARLSIEIDAPVGLVWRVLTDIDAYGKWNPMTPKVTGKPAEGETLQLTARVGTRIRVQEQKVYEIVPERKLVWSRAFGGELVRGVRTQWLEPLPDGRTRYSTQDVFAGPLAGMTRSLYGETLHLGFQAMAEALKDTCEARAGTARRGIASARPEDREHRRLPHRASWYTASTAADLRPGDVRRVSACGQDLIVWRTQGGRVCAARNVCGHVASRLAPGARVKGEQAVPSIPVEFRTTAHGLGLQITEVSQLAGMSHSRHLVMPTPIDEHHTRITLCVSARMGEQTHRQLGFTSPLARFAVHSIVQWAFRRDVRRDAQRWTQRLHVDEGAPSHDFDRAVFQRWLSQLDILRREAA